MHRPLRTSMTILALAVAVAARPRVADATGCPPVGADLSRSGESAPPQADVTSPCQSTDPPIEETPPSDSLSTSSTLRSGESLLVEQFRRSADGRFTLLYQGDGNLVLLDGSPPVWGIGAQGTVPGQAAMQGDGNFVIYNVQGQAVCASGTAGHDGAFLEVLTDGDVVLYRADGVMLRDRYAQSPSLCEVVSSSPPTAPPTLPPPPIEPSPSIESEEVVYFHVNNPLRYVDPDGLDALLINYTDGSHGFGHMGIMALNSDGSGLYGGFNPVNAGRPINRGRVESMSFPAGSIALSSWGRPTDTSLARLREQLAKLDGRSRQAIRIRHIKTSDAETAALAAYIQQSITARSTYVAGLNDCLDYCVRGLWSAGIPAPPPSAVFGGAIPDWYFRSLLLDLASRLSEWSRQSTPKWRPRIAFKGSTVSDA